MRAAGPSQREESVLESLRELDSVRLLGAKTGITREPRDYQKAGVTAIAAQQLFGSGVKLRPGQDIEYIIDSESER